MCIFSKKINNNQNVTDVVFICNKGQYLQNDKNQMSNPPSSNQYAAKSSQPPSNPLYKSIPQPQPPSLFSSPPQTQQQQVPGLFSSSTQPTSYNNANQYGSFQTQSNTFFDNYGSVSPISNLRLLTPKVPNVKVAAIVVTFSEGMSYDQLFTNQQQKSEEGSQTLVYAGNEAALQEIINGFNKDSKNEVTIGLVEDIMLLDPDCTVFNWECCSNYSNSVFTRNETVFKFVELMLGRGHMLMFSDFSLKALISQWNPQVLGPNPFAKVVEYSGNVVLKFDPETLKKSPSAQLQLVGTLSDGGMCNVNAAGGTIGYTVNWTIPPKTDRYTLEVLSIASNVSGCNSPCKIGAAKGAAGHCLLTYPNGGKLLTSMTHWISLMEIDTSEKKIIEVAQMNYGNQYAAQMQQQMQGMSAAQKTSYVQSVARDYVQSSAPCNNYVQKQKFK